MLCMFDEYCGSIGRGKFNWLCRLALDNDFNLQARFHQAILPDSGIEFFAAKLRQTGAEIVGNATDRGQIARIKLLFVAPERSTV